MSSHERQAVACSTPQQAAHRLLVYRCLLLRLGGGIQCALFILRAHGWTASADFPPLGRLRSVGSQQRLSSGPGDEPKEPQAMSPRSHVRETLPQPTGSMSKWLLGLAAIAAVAVLHIFSSVSTQTIGEDAPSTVHSDHSSGGHATAKPTWASLGRLGHELLTQKEHAYVPVPSVAPICSCFQVWIS